jgi:hypothetical protein
MISFNMNIDLWFRESTFTHGYYFLYNALDSIESALISFVFEMLHILLDKFS